MSLDYLAKLNAHPRDAFIQFDEPTHVYTVHGDKTFMSVTTWNHHHFPKFDADKIINQIISSKKLKAIVKLCLYYINLHYFSLSMFFY